MRRHWDEALLLQSSQGVRHVEYGQTRHLDLSLKCVCVCVCVCVHMQVKVDSQNYLMQDLALHCIVPRM